MRRRRNIRGTECAVAMVQSECEEEQKYIECVMVLVQSEHEEEYKYFECAVVLV